MFDAQVTVVISGRRNKRTSLLIYISLSGDQYFSRNASTDGMSKVVIAGLIQSYMINIISVYNKYR